MAKFILHTKTPFIPIIFFIIVLQLVACQQQQLWKKPTPVAISMKIKSQDANGPGYLEFTHGEITLSKIVVEGILNNADDFRFERNFPSGLLVNFNDTNMLEDLIFDLPQGEYAELRVNFETTTNNQNIFVEGIYDYNNPNRPNAFVNFSVDSVLLFNIVVANTQGSQSFNINAATSNLEIELNPPYWFKNTTATLMNNANTVTISNQSYININSSTNTNIYQSAKARIGGDTQSALK